MDLFISFVFLCGFLTAHVASPQWLTGFLKSCDPLRGLVKNCMSPQMHPATEVENFNAFWLRRFFWPCSSLPQASFSSKTRSRMWAPWSSPGWSISPSLFISSSWGPSPAAGCSTASQVAPSPSMPVVGNRRVQPKHASTTKTTPFLATWSSERGLVFWGPIMDYSFDRLSIEGRRSPFPRPGAWFEEAD